MTEEEKLKLVKCHKCGHEWDTKSKHIMVTCPCCQSKTKNEEVKNGKN